jgi:hypothetical protein
MTISLVKLLKIYRFERVIRRKTATQLNKGANSSLLLLFQRLVTEIEMLKVVLCLVSRKQQL